MILKSWAVHLLLMFEYRIVGLKIAGMEIPVCLHFIPHYRI